MWHDVVTAVQLLSWEVPLSCAAVAAAVGAVMLGAISDRYDDLEDQDG